MKALFGHMLDRRGKTPPKPEPNGAVSAREVVETLYRAVLRREADSEGADHFSRLIEAGATTQEVADSLRASPEYQTRFLHRRHPLGHLRDVYREEDVSFFMHRGRFRPLTISIETINICNNDCVICPYSAQTRKRQTMRPELFTKVVADYVTIGGGPISLTPLVGEVFLDKHLSERLALLRQTASVTSVSATTNAVMVHRFGDGTLAQLLAGIDRLNISVYGLDSEEYLAMTRRDDYELFRRGLLRILALARPGSVQLAIRQLRVRNPAEIEAWRDAVMREARRADCADLRINVEHRFANWSHFDSTQPLPMQAEWRPQPHNIQQCGIPLLGLQIMSDGQVSFCACANFDGTPNLMLGDINKQTLAEMLDSEVCRRLWDWEGCGVPDFCKKCSFHASLDHVAGTGWVFSDPIRYIGG